MDRVNTGILTSSIIGSVYSVVILGVMFLWSRQISLLFVDASETVILDQARQMLLINMVFYIPLTLVNVVRFTVQGMGFSKFAILAGVCEMIGRSVVAFFLVPYFGYTAVCFASRWHGFSPICFSFRRTCTAQKRFVLFLRKMRR